MNTPIRSFVVVGGGTAGWMAAAYLNRVFANSGNSDVTVTVIESEVVGIIGVGEATLPTLRTTLEALGIPEWRLIAAADATYKHGIKFCNWSLDPATHPSDYYYHMFDGPGVVHGYNMMIHWQAMREANATTAKFHEFAGPQAALCDANRSPKLYNSPLYAGPVAYGYHLDAVKFGALLREIAEARGVRRIQDDVLQVKLSSPTTISGVITRNHGLIEADFFVDCSGFSAILIEQALHEPFRDMSDALLCDRAVAIQVPHAPSQTTLRPYTTATAKSSGWIWDIDLFTRRGTGYVYASEFISDDDAEAELRAHLGPAARTQAAKRLKMRVGHRERLWVGNCLAVGLASGFIEPLESTGIYLIEMALTLFTDYVDANRDTPALRNRYNTVMSNLYEELRDFIVLHYITTMRDDTPFWKAYRNEVKPSAALASKLELWESKVPGTSDLTSRVTVFAPFSYFFVLAGMRCLPKNGIGIQPYLNSEMFPEIERGVAAMHDRALTASPDHFEFVKKMRSTAL